ncbi:hypothetical protein SAMN04489730_7575 [Amycolatopsis australiensis]|uniref:Uncharacterized protein n=1 Tax=Amycolatopsis australiensis TaxID=546364 RepID=A0A1K1T323_9PSEU|nr:hypothetical protein SAMN04489730_7575 [Amycolatopsis australiensis]
MIILGVAGLLAHLVVTVPPQSAPVVTGSSWAAIGIGLVLLLTALAQHGYGYGVFVLALGVGAVVAHQVTHFDGRIHAPQPLFGIVVASLVGVGAIAVSFADGGDEAIVRLPFFAVASLLADIFVDFGSGWDSLMNVSTAFFAVASVATPAVIFVADGLSDVESLADHYRTRLLLAAGAGAGVAAVLITILASFDLPSFVGVLLTSAAVLGGYLVVPLLAFLLLYSLVGRETWDAVPDQVVADAVGSEQARSAVGALAAGLAAVAALVTAIFGGLADWLVIVLGAGAAGAAAVAVRWGMRALTALVFAIKSGARPGRIARVLDELLRSDPVFRLLPGAGKS